jgi:hypothetical protein
MKMILPLCLIVVLAGCTSTETPAKKGPVNGMDSPIIISDGASSHLKHKGTGADFQITGTSVTVSDPGFKVGAGECWKGISSCPPSFMALATPWNLDIYDSGGVKIMTTSSSDNMTVTTTFYDNPISPAKDGGDTNGTDLKQKDYTFQNAMYSTGGGTPVPITCTSTPCKLRIHYTN